MSNRFEAIGSFVYEKGNRIGVTLDEASVELARKLNAYQMRIERLKAEVERLNDAIMRGASIHDAKPTE
jgi:phosphopantetheine adenylyltransferase